MAGSTNRIFAGSVKTIQNEPILSQVTVVARLLTVDTEVVRINGTKKWIIRIRVVPTPFLQGLESRFRGRGVSRKRPVIV